MKLRFCALFLGFFTLIGFTQPVLSQQTAARSAPREDSSYIDEEGKAYITRIVPVPQTISPEAQKSLARQATRATSEAPSPPKKSQPARSRQMTSGPGRALSHSSSVAASLWGSRTRPPVLIWASMRLARTC